ncbi:hypothetical protein B0H14DRAFT_3151512 [Mycena olivaceomarginata]|nr:hypothetical protein B0H14DRAFT_3151512 [Mycena olivaceomarginata]
MHDAQRRSRRADEEETKKEEDNDKNQVKERVQHLAGADENQLQLSIPKICIVYSQRNWFQSSNKRTKRTKKYGPTSEVLNSLAATPCLSSFRDSRMVEAGEDVALCGQGFESASSRIVNISASSAPITFTGRHPRDRAGGTTPFGDADGHGRGCRSALPMLKSWRFGGDSVWEKDFIEELGESASDLEGISVPRLVIMQGTSINSRMIQASTWSGTIPVTSATAVFFLVWEHFSKEGG